MEKGGLVFIEVVWWQGRLLKIRSLTRNDLDIYYGKHESVGRIIGCSSACRGLSLNWSKVI
jgi:hypothetical protein